jgi:hypothetical protein
MAVAVTSDPFCTRKTTLERLASAIRLEDRIYMENAAGHLPVRIVSLGIQKSQIRDDVLLVVSCQGRSRRRQVRSIRIKRWCLHEISAKNESALDHQYAQAALFESRTLATACSRITSAVAGLKVQQRAEKAVFCCALCRCFGAKHSSKRSPLGGNLAEVLVPRSEKAPAIRTRRRSELAPRTKIVRTHITAVSEALCRQMC